MKRSDINRIIKNMEKVLKEYKIELPPFLSWTPQEWATKGHEYDEIRDNMLGWDVTDYGMGKFDELGIVLITLRNGNANNPAYTKTYAEKLIYIQEGQVSPMHFHWNKMEDIINKGGGDCVFRLYNADDNEQLENTDVMISRDGRNYKVPAGEKVIIKPGESLSLYPYYYHEFYVEKGQKGAILGEVSMCNDDNTDNRFEQQLGRFPKIEEDEPPYRLLCNEYPAATSK